MSIHICLYRHKFIACSCVVARNKRTYKRLYTHILWNLNSYIIHKEACLSKSIICCEDKKIEWCHFFLWNSSSPELQSCKVSPKKKRFTSCLSMNPCCFRSYNWKETVTLEIWHHQLEEKSQAIEDFGRLIINMPYITNQEIWNLHSILSSIGAFGWKTERARANSSKSNIPLCFVSNKSNT